MHIYLAMVITMGCDTVLISDLRLLNLVFASKEVHWSGSVFVIDSRKVGGPDRKILHDRFLLSLSFSPVVLLWMVISPVLSAIVEFFH